jgi:hypothetical protein
LSVLNSLSFNCFKDESGLGARQFCGNAEQSPVSWPPECRLATSSYLVLASAKLGSFPSSVERQRFAALNPMAFEARDRLSFWCGP